VLGFDKNNELKGIVRFNKGEITWDASNFKRPSGVAVDEKFVRQGSNWNKHKILFCPIISSIIIIRTESSVSN